MTLIRSGVTTLAAFALVLLCPAVLPASAGTPSQMTCTPRSWPVILPGGAAGTVTGAECTRGNPAAQPWIVAEPGGSYSHLYWDWPQEPSHYNFAYAATLAGFTVLTLDEPATPPFDGPPWPPAASVTIPGAAAALHQVLGTLPAKKIILAGHSIGSYITWTEQSSYPDPAVKGLLITGALHAVNQPGEAQVIAGTHPAQDDPAFAALGLPDGYLTTMPGTRGADFYNADDAAPAVIAQDEATKATVTVPVLQGIPAALDPALTRAIRLPVMLQVGTADLLNCGTGLPCGSRAAILSREAGDWGGPVTAFVLPGSGHDLTTALNGPLATAVAIAWAAAIAGNI